MYCIDEIKKFCFSRGKTKCILDTNLLILLLIGIFEENYIADCQLTSKYNIDDYKLLVQILGYFDVGIITTPHIIAEISNLSRMKITNHKLDYYFQVLINRLNSFQEEHVNLGTLLNQQVQLLIRLGFPDMSILETAKNIKATIITDDMDLHLHAITNKIPAVNFTNVSRNVYK